MLMTPLLPMFLPSLDYWTCSTSPNTSPSRLMTLDILSIFSLPVPLQLWFHPSIKPILPYLIIESFSLLSPFPPNHDPHALRNKSDLSIGSIVLTSPMTYYPPVYTPLLPQLLLNTFFNFPPHSLLFLTNTLLKKPLHVFHALTTLYNTRNKK